MDFGIFQGIVEPIPSKRQGMMYLLKKKKWQKIQIKTTMRYHLTLIRMAIIKMSTNAGEGVEKREPSCTIGGNVNWYSHYGRRYRDSLKN